MIVYLTGIGHGGSSNKAAIAYVTVAAVLKNVVIVGSVNANKRHWYRAGQILTRADGKWANRLITQSERPEYFRQTLERKPDASRLFTNFLKYDSCSTKYQMVKASEEPTFKMFNDGNIMRANLVQKHFLRSRP